MYSRPRRVPSILAIAMACCTALILAGCGTDSSEVNAGGALGRTATASEVPANARDTGNAGDAATPSTVAPAESYEEPPVQWEEDPADVALRSIESVEDRWSIEVLGMAMIGFGEFVRLTDPMAEDQESECGSGWLGFQFEDGAIHTYDELGTIGHARLFNGPRGQDAIVISCEESTERVLVQGSAVLPDTGIPELADFVLGQPHLMDFDADFGWRGDLFGGYGWHGGWDELIFFDTGTGFVTEGHVMLGTRYERLGSGFDFVLPNGWDLRQANPGDGAVEMWATDQSAWISILPVEFAGDPEFPDGATPDGFFAGTAGLWQYVSVDRAQLIGQQDRPTWTVATEDGTHAVMHLEGGAVDLIIESFISENGASSATTSVVTAAVEQIRTYDEIR